MDLSRVFMISPYASYRKQPTRIINLILLKLLLETFPLNIYSKNEQKFHLAFRYIVTSAFGNDNSLPDLNVLCHLAAFY